ncbi:phosphonate C-P lyase system protein PhnH [Siculibacillus lacustris]|uniref:Phosphonate C-P lyase system protein PhnH n=1 Tax=Siculibacillus lacustris TaxID=1549641 RepID=A0A4Q9VPE2_9HYPH|nr:phosphonate C-P lyase system protein PhnH [Siculibacillus lacustris]TBW37591.1 phosphonate C-P lyase system protein PhnH [Siculibacillus lacustris]
MPAPLAATLRPGFADPVFDAQAAFRAAMSALAEPGTIRSLAGLDHAPAPLGSIAAALILALADYETPLWRDALLATPEIDAWLRFHTGAPFSDAPDAAAFALVSGAEALGDLDRFSHGSDLAPEASTTVILTVAGFGADTGGVAFRLAGPGIDGTRDVTIAGAPVDLAERRAADLALYPRGLDLLLAGPNAVLGLPRTTRIERI